MTNFCVVREEGLEDVAYAPTPVEARLKHHYRRLRCAVMILFLGVILQAPMSILTAQVDNQALCVALGDDRPACHLQQTYRYRLFVEIMAGLGGTCNCLVYAGQLLYRRRLVYGRNLERGRNRWLGGGNLSQRPSVVAPSTSLRSALSTRPDTRAPLADDEVTSEAAAAHEDTARAVGGPGKSVKVSHSVHLYQPRPRPVKFFWSLACILHCLEFAAVWRVRAQLSETARFSCCVVATTYTVIEITRLILDKWRLCSARIRKVVRLIRCPIYPLVSFWITTICAATGCFGPYLAARKFAATSDTRVTLFWSWLACIVNSFNSHLTAYCMKQRPDLTALLATYSAFVTMITATIEYCVIQVDDAKSATITQLIGITPHGYIVPIIALVGGLLTAIGSANTVALGTGCLKIHMTMIGVATSILMPPIAGPDFTRLEYYTRILTLLQAIWIASRPDIFFSEKVHLHIIQQLKYNKQWSLTKSPLEGRKVQVTGASSDSHYALVRVERRSRLQPRTRRSRSTSSVRSSRTSRINRSNSSRSSLMERRRMSHRAAYSHRGISRETHWNAHATSLPPPSATSLSSSFLDIETLSDEARDVP